MNSRYYLRFKDNYRQLAFDVLQGVKVTEEEMTTPSKVPQTNSNTNNISLNNNKSLNEDAERQAREENVRQLVADCRKQLVDTNEDCYGSWALINYHE